MAARAAVRAIFEPHEGRLGTATVCLDRDVQMPARQILSGPTVQASSSPHLDRRVLDHALCALGKMLPFLGRVLSVIKLR